MPNVGSRCLSSSGWEFQFLLFPGCDGLRQGCVILFYHFVDREVNAGALGRRLELVGAIGERFEINNFFITEY